MSEYESGDHVRNAIEEQQRWRALEPKIFFAPSFPTLAKLREVQEKVGHLRMILQALLGNDVAAEVEKSSEGLYKARQNLASCFTAET